LRSVERSVEEVLLPSLNEIGDKHGYDSAPWNFAGAVGPRLAAARAAPRALAQPPR